MRHSIYHSHCSYCDGKGTIDQFVSAAAEANFSAYGISTHCPLPFDAPWVIPQAQVGNYLADIEMAKQKYGDRLEVYAGMEIDYLDGEYNPANAYFQGLALDYRIGSVHFVPSERDARHFVDVDCGVDQFARDVDYHFSGSLERVVRAYYAAKRAMIEAGGFDFVGHADKISMNVSQLSGKITEKAWYKDLVAEFLRVCAERNVRLEVNTKAWEVKGVFFPDARYFEEIARLGIGVVVNSDAHRTDRISWGLEEALGALRGAGVERIEELRGGAWRLREF